MLWEHVIIHAVKKTLALLQVFCVYYKCLSFNQNIYMINFFKRLISNVKEIKATHEKSLLKRKNVCGVGISGEKIIVLVEKKLPLEELKEKDIVPENLDGFDTDVIEVGKVSTSTVSACPMGGTACSIGAICYKDNKPHYLQNSHCLFDSVGKSLISPSPLDGGRAKDKIGTVVAQTTYKSKGNKVDALIAIADDETIDTSIETDTVKFGDVCNFVGRTSGQQILKVLAQNITINVNNNGTNYEFVDQIMLEGIVRGGDSGSGLFRNGKLVGLIFASNNVNIAFANNISNVVSELGITFKKTVPQKTWRYFKLTEKTGTYGTIADLLPELVDKLDEARHIAGVPFKITSGYRNPKHNAQVGGVDDSTHTTKEAVDIACTDSAIRWKIINALIQVGFNRIGVAKNFIHADISKTKPQNVIWTY